MTHSNHKMSEVHEKHETPPAPPTPPPPPPPPPPPTSDGRSSTATNSDETNGSSSSHPHVHRQNHSSLVEENRRLREQLRSMRADMDRLLAFECSAAASMSPAATAAASRAAAAVLTEPPLPRGESPSKHRRSGGRSDAGGGGGLSRISRAVGNIVGRGGGGGGDGDEQEYATLATNSDVMTPQGSPIRLDDDDVEAGGPRRQSQSEGLEMKPLASTNGKKKRGGSDGDKTLTTEPLDGESDDDDETMGSFADEALDAAAIRNRPPPENGVDYEPFSAVMKDRASWLVGLLVLQSMSSFIIARNEALLESHIVIVQFLTMLVGAGGNAGNQASVRVIRGLALGTLNGRTIKAFLWTEAKMAVCLSFILGVTGLLRAAAFKVPAAETTAITAALYMIVFLSIFIGSLLPLGMKWCGIDPAHSSTTIQVLMDILGVTMTVHVSSLILYTGIGDVITAWAGGGGDAGGGE